jgi:thiol-disulfide isomerase/thioredoxin
METGAQHPRAHGDDRPARELAARAREVVAANHRLGVRAPDFPGDFTWLNVSRPLALARELAGRVVLIDFWTYCCINCQHVLPDLEQLEARFAKAPFAVVGCHSAKFANERDARRVREAVLRHGIAHPVVIDEEFRIWQAYAVRAWPTLVLVSHDGRVVAQVSGEGQRDVLQALIGAALELAAARPAAALAPLPLAPERDAELPLPLAFPGKLALDPGGERLFVSDGGHHRVLELDLAGRFLRAFGDGRPGFLDGPAARARFREPQGLAHQRGPAGEALLVCDTGNHALRRVDLATGIVTTLAGNGRQGELRHVSRPARQVALNSPWDVAVVDEHAYVAMAGSHQIWRVELEGGRRGDRGGSEAGLAEDFAGDGSEQKLDGERHASAFAQPSGLAAVESSLYVADSESSAVRELDLDTGLVGTVAGAGAEPRDLFHFGDQDGSGPGRRFQHPLGIAPRGRTLVVADTYNHRVKELDPDTGAVRALAGDGQAGHRDGPLAAARFCEPGGLAAAGARIYVADSGNHCVRVVDLERGVVETLPLADVPLADGAPRAWGRRADAPSGCGGPLPPLAGAREVSIAARLAPGRVVLALDLALELGEVLAADAPSQFRVWCRAGARAEREAGLLERAASEHVLELESPAAVRVEALWYVCGPDGTCRVRSAAWDLALEPAAGAARRLEIDARAPA